MMNRLTIAAIAVAVSAIAVAIAFYIIVVKAPTDLAHNAAEGIRKVMNFTPEVRLNENIVVERTDTTLELATVSKTMQVETEYQSTSFGSTKTLRVRSTYIAKAGFNLRKGKGHFRLTVQQNPMRITAELPEPEILSIERGTDYKIVTDESGWWNSITPTDREAVEKRMDASARAKAESSGILKEARTLAEEQMRGVVQAVGSTIDFKPKPE